MQFLAEACGADREAKYQGRTSAEIIVQLRRPELDNEETRFSWGRRDADAVREARESMVDILENAQGTTS
jgi:beta-mannanase